MSLGPEAYVEEPKKLRDMVQAELKKALIQYEALCANESETLTP